MIRYHLACVGFELCTHAGAQLGGKQLLDRVQMKLFIRVLIHAPRNYVTELRCNSPLSKTVKIGTGPRT